MKFPPGAAVSVRTDQDGALIIEVHTDVTADEGDNILSVQDVAARLGRTTRTIYSYLSRRKNPLPHSRVSGSIAIFERDLIRWLDIR